jgi:hypothetical protein
LSNTLDRSPHVLCYRFVHLHTDGEGSPARFYKDLAPLSRVLREQLVDVLLPSDATPTSSAPSHLGPAPIPNNPIEVGPSTSH